MRSATAFLPDSMIDVHELRQIHRAELRIGQDLALGYFATTWHWSLPSFVSVGANRFRSPLREELKRPFTYSARSAVQNRPVARRAANGWPAKFATAAVRCLFGRLAPYFERDCLRSLTPCRSSEPRTMW